MTRRTLLAPLIAAAGLLLMAGRADAHAEFVGAPGSLAPDSDVSLVMNVPHERDDATYNAGVAIQLPAGWRVVSCQSKDTWTCASATDGGRAVLRFTKADGAGPAEDETFRFVLHTGTDGGTFTLPTVQTYNTGEVVRWIENAGGAEPAPALTVSGSAPATTAAPVDTTAATTAATTATTEAPATSAAPASTAAPETTVAPTTATTVAPTTAATTTTTSAPATTTNVASTTTAAATTTIAVIAPAPTSSTGDDGGSNAGVIVLVVVLAGAGAGAGFYLARRRRPKPAA